MQSKAGLRIPALIALFWAPIIFFLAAVLPLPSAPAKSTALSDSYDTIDLRQRVRKIVLPNGMKFLLLRRSGAPVFSAEIRMRVGSIEEKAGSTGLAHFFEHMAFKGTDRIGSKDFANEGPILKQVIEVGSQIAELKKQGKPPEEYEGLTAQLKDLVAKENQYVVKNEFVQIYQKNGGDNLNATTSNDFTTYYISLPSNKLELWAYMESHRLKVRVLREFFSEIDVVAEERRMRYDNDPEGRLYEAFLARGFDKSPYKVNAIGTAEDIQTYTPQAAMEFYQTYYVPSRMVGAVVGNIDLDETEALVRRYFGSLEKKPDRPRKFEKEVFDQSYPRSITLAGPDKPRFYMGYHRPANPHPDDEVFDMIQSIMCEGRSSRLYRRLILEKKRVASVDCYGSLPGARLDSLFAFHASPLDGFTNAEIAGLIREEIAKLASAGPTERELAIVKNNIDADLIYSMESNAGLASKLTFYESLTGDWRYVYHFQKRVHEITAGDVKRVIKSYFVTGREVMATLEEEFGRAHWPRLKRRWLELVKMGAEGTP